MSGLATARGHGGGPCHKDFGCEDGTYVKFEFVEYYDEEEEEHVCYFEEETDTGLIEITDWDSKEGVECEPIYVEWESTSEDPAYVATEGLAFGGNDCDPVPDPEGGSYTSNLENNGGNTAAISNLQFCVVSVEEIIGTINLSYEDLPMDDSGIDWDVNDWVVDLIGTFKAAGEDNGTPLVTEFTFDIVPQARGAADDHEWHMFLPSAVLCAGSYELSVKDGTGSEIRSDGGTFDGGSDVDVNVFPSTEAVLDDLENAELPGQTDGCTAPNEWATLTVTFDDPCAIEVPQEEGDVNVNGDNLFFDPYLKNLESPTEVHRGDVRLVVVPDDWQWPLGAVQIWDAYTEVDEVGGEPAYTTDNWYDTIAPDADVATCDFDPVDLGGS